MEDGFLQDWACLERHCFLGNNAEAASQFNCVSEKGPKMKKMKRLFNLILFFQITNPTYIGIVDAWARYWLAESIDRCSPRLSIFRSKLEFRFSRISNCLGSLRTYTNHFNDISRWVRGTNQWLCLINRSPYANAVRMIFGGTQRDGKARQHGIHTPLWLTRWSITGLFEQSTTCLLINV